MLALAKGDLKRLERLAALAGRTPRSMLKFVLRDGFEAVERDILETLAAEQDASTDGAVQRRSSRQRVAERQARRLEWARPARAAYAATLERIAEEDVETAALFARPMARSLALLQLQPWMGTPSVVAARRV